jgi:MFS family permease
VPRGLSPWYFTRRLVQHRIRDTNVALRWTHPLYFARAFYQLLDRLREPGSNRAKAFGALGGVTAVGVAAGPMVGGTLTTYASWRWGFIGEFLLVLILVGLTLRYLPSQPSDEAIELDIGGTILSILGILGIIGGSLLAGHYGWIRPVRPLEINGTLIQPLGLSPAIWCIGLGIATLVAFIHWELRQERSGRPTLIPPVVLRNRTFAAGISTFATQSLILAGFMFTVPVFLQSALGFSVFDRQQLAVQLEDAVETTTPAQQESFMSGLSPEVQQQVSQIILDSMVTAQ